MRCNILITLFLVFASIWDTGKWIESKKMPGKCDHEYIVLFEPNAILETSNFDSAVMYEPYKKAVTEYKALLNKRFGHNITENLLFSDKWRELQAALSRKICGDSSITADPWMLSIGGFMSFSDHPDFIMFGAGTCQIRGFSWYGVRIKSWKIVYLANIDSSFQLSKYESENPANGKMDRAALLKDFNFWVDNSKDLANMQPECEAAILLHILYREEQVSFINSFEDLTTARAMELAREASRYIGDDSTDEAGYPGYLNDYFLTDLKNIEQDYPTINIFKKEALTKDSIEGGMLSICRDYDYHEPIIVRDHSRTSLTLTVYCNEELANWKIVFDKDNHVISMDRVTEPIRE